MDWYAYPVLNAQQQPTIQITTAGGLAQGYLTFQPEHYFLCCGFAAACDRYDNAAGVFASASSDAVIGQARVPNCFSVQIQRASANNYANQNLSQAELCSSGYMSGKQFPYPVIYGPSETVSFKFTDLTGLFLLTQAGAAIPLTISLWMFGYTLQRSADGKPNSNLRRLLNGYFPSLARAYPELSGAR